MTRTAVTVAAVVLTLACACGGAFARDMDKLVDKQNMPAEDAKTAALMPLVVAPVAMRNLLLPAIQKVRDAAARP
jgi:hypothetical protein